MADEINCVGKMVLDERDVIHDHLHHVLEDPVIGEH